MGSGKTNILQRYHKNVFSRVQSLWIQIWKIIYVLLQAKTQLWEPANSTTSSFVLWRDRQFKSDQSRPGQDRQFNAVRCPDFFGTDCVLAWQVVTEGLWNDSCAKASVLDKPCLRATAQLRNSTTQTSWGRCSRTWMKDYLSLNQKDYELIPKLYSVILANMSQPHNRNRGPMLKEILAYTISLFSKVSIVV